MIANLITTLLLALGVATGTYQSESGNAFNHVVEEKQEKPIKKATTQTYTKQFDNYFISQWDDEVNNTHYKKYYINDKWTQAPETPTYLLENMILYGCIYDFSYAANSYYYNNDFIYITKIKNIYTSATEIELETTFVRLYASGDNYYGYQNYISSDNRFDEVIDLTINGSTKSTFDYAYSHYNKTLLNKNDQHDGQTGTLSVDNTTNTITLQPDETIYLIMVNYHSFSTSRIDISSDAIMNDFYITSSYIEPTYTQEIVNVPELMFTIVTLPFAFYSTAFNLTIFPNTPYALNFGNLILTILAALILLYLIKKVLK